MITVAEPPSLARRAYALSLALHLCALALIAALVPLWHASGYGLRDEAAACSAPCGRVFAISIERHARAAATMGFRRIAETLIPPVTNVRSAVAQPVVQFHAYRVSPKATAWHHDTSTSTAQLASAGDGGTNRNLSTVTAPPAEVASASRLQPNAVSANPSRGSETLNDPRKSDMLGPANWGSHFDVPTLRDRSLYDEIVAMLPKRGSITIVVDDQGRATAVRIDAPGLDPAVIDDLRKRLMSAEYAPVERDGISYDGTLIIRSSSPAH